MIDENKNCTLIDRCNHIDCDCFCLRRYKTERLYDNGILSEKQRRRTSLVLDADERDKDSFEYLAGIEKHIVNFVESGGNIYIHSTTTGNGKTSWALRMLQAYVNKMWAKARVDDCIVLFVHVPRLLVELKNNIDSKSDYVTRIKSNIANAHLVVWDEVGTKGLTQFEHENVLNFLNTRLDCGKANIFTSNLTNEELHSAVGDRLYSRIVLNSDEVELFGADKRALRL